MNKCLTVVSCALLVVAAASTADARNRLLRFVVQEPIPAPATEIPPPQEQLVPSRPSFQPAPRLPAPKSPLQRLSVQKAPTYGPVQSGAVYHKPQAAPKIRYVQHFPHKRSCCGCQTTLDAVLTVEDPRTCRLIDVPVCLPGCCTGKPSVHGHAGILRRGVTAYHWPCGYKVRVVIDHHGDVIVHYFGR